LKDQPFDELHKEMRFMMRLFVNFFQVRLIKIYKFEGANLKYF